MPTHWESSERPLFVKTVVVNGNRHAILSQVDPLCHLTSSTRKSGENLQCNTCSSTSYLDSKDMSNHREETAQTRYYLPIRRAKSCYQSNGDISTDLQDCLVKLRVVLSSHENKKKIKKEVLCMKDDTKSDITHNKPMWKHLKKKWNLDKSECENFVQREEKIEPKIRISGTNRTIDQGNMNHEECMNNESVMTSINNEYSSTSDVDADDQQEKMNLVGRILPITESTERYVKRYSGYFFPIVYIKTDDFSWDDSTTENYFTKNVQNPLSDRVLQWLDLDRRRKENSDTAEEDRNLDKVKSANRKKILVEDKKQNSVKCDCEADQSKQEKNSFRSSEWNSSNILKKTDVNGNVEEEGVKQECDVETVLSLTTHREYPKYSKELNKLHNLKSSEESVKTLEEDDGVCVNYSSCNLIPEKTQTESRLTMQLQQSILNSFEAVVNLDSQIKSEIENGRKDAPSPVMRNIKRKGLLMKQTNIRISSDEEEECFVDSRNRRILGERRKSFSVANRTWRMMRRKYRSVHSLSGTCKVKNQEPSDDGIRDVHIIYNETPLNPEAMHGLDDPTIGCKKIWTTEKGVNKPQLHIFMPGIDPKKLEREESTSDAESLSKFD